MTGSVRRPDIVQVSASLFQYPGRQMKIVTADYVHIPAYRPASNRFLRGLLRITLGLGTTVLAPGCTDNAAPPLTLTVAELESPAGPGSGEPRLSEGAYGTILSWLERSSEGGHDLRVARMDGSTWGGVHTVAHSERFFVNWADFPSVSEAADGALYAHWLARGDEGGYDYGVRIARSTDGGVSWGEPWTPHDDDSPTEHGFVSTVRSGDRLGFTWLDGRAYAEDVGGSPATQEMSLRYREVGPGGEPGPEMLVDARVCDCCQTSSAMASGGPVVVYRDRTEDEIRDIYIARMVDGVWTEGRAVSDDGWHIAGCPVNGPAVVADGQNVVVAWFTAPEDVARVKVAFSTDGGVTFGSPVVVDDGNPMGRVDLVMANDGAAIVSWLETGDGSGAEVKLRRVSGDGTASGSASVTTSSAERASGFPQLIQHSDGSLMMAWTDVGGEDARVRVARVEVSN